MRDPVNEMEENEPAMSAEVIVDPMPTIPAPRQVRRGGAMIFSFVSSILLNLLVVGILLLIAVDEQRRTPPAILVKSAGIIDDPVVEPPKVDLPVIGPVSGSASAAINITVATSASPLSMNVPEVTSFDNGLAGLDGIGPGFGAGLGTAGPGSGREGGSMKIGRMEVRSMRLGVILDVSGSMQSLLPEVKREIRKGFSSAEIVNVEGCRLDWRPVEGEELDRVKLKREAKSVIEAVEMLVVAGKVDAIYWFSDLQDGETEEGVARLGQLLRIDGAKPQRVKLYIRSLQNPPRRELATIVRASGGAVQAGDKIN